MINLFILDIVGINEDELGQSGDPNRSVLFLMKRAVSFYAKIVLGKVLIGHNFKSMLGGVNGTFCKPLKVPHLLFMTILQKFD